MKFETRQSLQQIVDPFVKASGGKLISEFMDDLNPKPNADYIFPQLDLIAELKALETASFGDSFQRKLSDSMTRWYRNGSLIGGGVWRIDSDQMSQECRDEMFEIMAEPLQKHVIAAANRQIGQTKQLLDMPSAKGLLMVASDGNKDLQPNLVWFLLTRILRKRHPDGSHQFSQIDGIVYFSPRMPVCIPGTSRPATLWFSGERKTSDPGILEALHFLRNAWPQYLDSQGVRVEGRYLNVYRPEDIRFLGIKPSMPRVTIGHP